MKWRVQLVTFNGRGLLNSNRDGLWTSGSQSDFKKPTASASPENLLERQIHGFTPYLFNQKFWFNSFCKWFWCLLKFEDHWIEGGVLSQDTWTKYLSYLRQGPSLDLFPQLQHEVIDLALRPKASHETSLGLHTPPLISASLGFPGNKISLSNFIHTAWNKDYISQPLLPLGVAICQILPSEKRMKVMCMSLEKFPQRGALCCSFSFGLEYRYDGKSLINYLISQAEVKYRGGKSNEIKGMLVLMISWNYLTSPIIDSCKLLLREQGLLLIILHLDFSSYIIMRKSFVLYNFMRKYYEKT